MIVPASPYKGLAPFADSELDALLFFGREHEIDLVNANLVASRLTLLYGPSGVGKSSLLQAGVAQRLRGESDEHDVLVLASWLDEPVEELKAAVSAAAERYLYVILDQFEEYFLYHGEAVGPFVQEVADLLSRPELRVNVLLSLRDDWLAKLDAFKGQLPFLHSNSLRLEHLDRAGGRRAILGPAARFGELTGKEVEVEPELVEAVLDEIETGRLDLAGRGAVEDPGSSGRVEAPFLQLVLERLWEAEPALRLETFRRLGGAEVIVRDHLERAMDALDAADKDLAAGVFNQLVTPSGTKIAHRPSDLAEYVSVGEAALLPVLSTLERERVVRSVDGMNGTDRRYEIFHDVLADAVIAWRAQQTLERERRAAAKRHRRLLVIATVALAALAVTSAVAVFALVERHQARSKAAAARAQTQLARSRALAATALLDLKGDPEHSVELALAAAGLNPSGQITDILRESLQASRLQLILPADAAAVFSPDGSRVLTGVGRQVRVYGTRSGKRLHVLPAGGRVTNVFSTDRLVVATITSGATLLWRSKDGALVRRLGSNGPLTGAALSRDGSVLAESSTDRHVRVLRLPDGKLLASIRLLRPARMLALSDNGTLLVTSSGDRSARVFSARSGRSISTLPHPARVTSVEISPRGDVVATTSLDGKTRLWDARSGTLIRPLGGRHGAIVNASFSTRGQLLVTAGSDGAARVWNVANGSLRAVMIGHTTFVSTAAFSRGGRWVITASGDRTARIWETANGRPRLVLSGHRDTVRAASFDRNGDRVLTLGADGTARLWDPGTKSELALLARQPAPVTAATVSPDGRFALSAGRDGTARIWTLPEHRLVRTLHQRGPVLDAAYSRDGRLVATAGADGTVRVRRAPSGEAVRTLRVGVPVRSVAFAPDGKTVLAAFGHHAGIWDVASGHLLRTFPQRGRVVDAAFGPGGRLVATAGTDRTAHVWTRGGAPVSVLKGHADALTSVGFSPDGRRLVTTSRDRDARLWSVGGKQLDVLHGHAGMVADASFSPDGRWVVTAGPRAAGLWDVVSGTLLEFVFGHSGQVTRASFAPDGRHVITGGADGTVRLFDCTLCGGTTQLIQVARLRTRELSVPLAPTERAHYLALR